MSLCAEKHCEKVSKLWELSLILMAAKCRCSEQSMEHWIKMKFFNVSSRMTLPQPHHQKRPATSVGQIFTSDQMAIISRKPCGTELVAPRSSTPCFPFHSTLSLSYSHHIYSSKIVCIRDHLVPDVAEKDSATSCEPPRLWGLTSTQALKQIVNGVYYNHSFIRKVDSSIVGV